MGTIYRNGHFYNSGSEKVDIDLKQYEIGIGKDGEGGITGGGLYLFKDKFTDYVLGDNEEGEIILAATIDPQSYSENATAKIYLTEYYPRYTGIEEVKRYLKSSATGETSIPLSELNGKNIKLKINKLGDYSLYFIIQGDSASNKTSYAYIKLEEAPANLFLDTRVQDLTREYVTIEEDDDTTKSYFCYAWHSSDYEGRMLLTTRKNDNSTGEYLPHYPLTIKNGYEGSINLLNGSSTTFKGSGLSETYGDTIRNSSIAGPKKILTNAQVNFIGPSCTTIDDGLSGIAPTTLIHGGCFIDMSDNYKRTGVNYLYMGNEFSRHPDAGITMPHGKPYGPWLHMHGNPSIIMDGGTLLKMHDQALFTMDGKAELVMHQTGSKRMYVEFSNERETASQSVFLFHGGDVKFEPNSEVRFGGNYYGTAKKSTFHVDAGYFHLDGSQIQLHGGTLKLERSDVLFEGGTWHLGHPGGSGECKIAFNGAIHMCNIDRGGTFNIDIQDSPNIQISQEPQIQVRGRTLTRLEGCSILQMHTYDNGSSWSAPIAPGPYFDMDNEQVIIATKGAELYGSAPYQIPRFREACTLGFGSFNELSKVSDPGATLLLEGLTRVRFGGKYSQRPTSIVVAGYEINAEGTGSITLKESAEMYRSGNSFSQMTGKSHFEMHDNSMIIMRGILPLVSEYAYDEHGDMYKDAEENYVMDKYIKQPWQDGYYAEWRRPITNDGKSPNVGLFDASSVLIRGVWNEEERHKVIKTMSFDMPELEVAPTSIEEFDEDTLEAFNLAVSKLTGSNNADNYRYISGGTVTSEALEDGGFTITVEEFTVTNKPIDWNPHPEKIENSPLVEIIENAEVRVTGKGQILVNDEGVTFGNASGSVTFSIEELTALKNLLNS